MLRYLRLYASFLRFSISRAMEFRFDFFFKIAMDVVFYLVNLGVFEVLFRHTSVLGGWDLGQARIFIAMFFVVDAIYMTVFSSNLWWLPSLINRGDLDYYLLRPISPLFFVTLREFAANSFVNLLMAIAILIWALWDYPQLWDMTSLALMSLFICNGTLLYMLCHLLFIIPVFWTQSGRGLGLLYFSVTRFAEKPDRIFKGSLRVVLTTVLPMSLIAAVPARLVLEGIDYGLLAYLFLVSFSFFAVVCWCWRWGLRQYSSASS